MNYRPISTKHFRQAKTLAIPQRTEVKVTDVKTDSGRHTFVFAVRANGGESLGWTTAMNLEVGFKNETAGLFVVVTVAFEMRLNLGHGQYHNAVASGRHSAIPPGIYHCPPDPTLPRYGTDRVQE